MRLTGNAGIFPRSMTKQATMSPCGGRSASAETESLARGKAALDQGQPEEAERIARDLLRGNAELPQGHHLLGLALLSQGNVAEAIAPLEAAAQDRGDPIVEMHLGIALREAKRTDDALIWLEQATTRQPPFLPAFQEFALTLCRLRRFDQAQIALERGLDAAPNAAELSVTLGNVFLSRADPANAKIAFARALANAPGHPRALQGFGTALLFEGAFARAAERFRQALAREPSYARARLDLAHCLLELGQRDEAIADLRALVRASPQFYGHALKILISAGRGQFWLTRSAASAFLNPSETS